MQETITQTFSLDEFVSSAWAEREEYSREEPEFEHVRAVHEASGGLEEWRLVDRDAAFFVHRDGPYGFLIYLYSIDGEQVAPEHKWPLWASPIMLFTGTTFDGVREMYGASWLSAEPSAVGRAILAVDAYVNERWVDCDGSLD